MSLNKDEVRKIATLARIKMSDDELSQTQEKLNTIMAFIEQLGEVNTDNVEPLPSPVNIKLPLRKDDVTDGNCVRDVLANAPEDMEDFYVVSKIVE